MKRHIPRLLRLRRRFAVNAPFLTYGNPRSGPMDPDAATELIIFIQNDGDLYRQQYLPIIKNLARKIGRGVFDSNRSVKLWEYLVHNGAKKYLREFGGRGERVDSVFNKNTRRHVAEHLAVDFIEKYRNREYSPEIMALGKGRLINPPRRRRPGWTRFRKSFGQEAYERAFVSPFRRRRRFNPLTRLEAAQQMGMADSEHRVSRDPRRPKRVRHFLRGMAFGRFDVVDWHGPKDSRKIAQQYKAAIRRYAPNPRPGATKIGRTTTLIKTTRGSVRPRGLAPLYGLKGGHVFIKGFFGNVPKGAVTRIEYLDEGKAQREGLKNPALPWRHDFRKERRPLQKVRGGLLITAGKKPLWGKV